MAITVYGGLKKWLLSEVLQYISYRVCIYVLSMHSYIYLPVLLTFISMSDDLPI